MRGVTIRLNEVEERVLELFLNNYDTNSQPLKRMMRQMFKTFVNEIGLRVVMPNKKIVELSDEEKEGVYTQELIDGWLKMHEKDRPNNNCRLFLQKFFRFLGNNDLELKKVKKYKSASKTPPDRDQVNNIIMNAYSLYGKKFAMYLKTVDLCALRKSEGLGIRPIDIVFTDNIAKIKIHGKGNRDRWVVIPINFYVSLLNYIKEYEIADSEYMFKFDYDDTQIMFSRACVVAGYYNFKKEKLYRTNLDGTIKYSTVNRKLPMFSLHSLRHSRATQWDKENEQLLSISRKLGHSDVSTTQLYINIDEKELMARWAEKHMNKMVEDYMERENVDRETAEVYFQAFLEETPQREAQEGKTQTKETDDKANQIQTNQTYK